MIVRFSLGNWMSFKDWVTFSMIASQERQHGERVPRIGKYHTRILPVAGLYGGNASGKSNFFKALDFVKNFVVKGTRPDSPIEVEPFRLDPSGTNQPTRFSCELLIDETIYEFSFAVTRQAVIEEKLVLISKTGEKVLYHRKDNKPNFDNSLKKDRDFLEFAFRGTRDNQLFLTNAVSQKVDTFRPVYDWFDKRLMLIAPDTRYKLFEQFLDEKNPLYATMNDILSQLDTGIAHLDFEIIPIENLGLPQSLTNKLQEGSREGLIIRGVGPFDERFVIAREKGDLIARKLVTCHTMSDGKYASFEMRLESDGSRRLIDLLPAFLTLSASPSNKIFVIDELDRSLHTLLTRRLLEAYLTNCTAKTRSQLLFTTHDVLLMDQDLLRRDEMWVTERDEKGISELFSFSEYKDVRYDKDIRKSYLQGRLGGIPRILLSGALNQPCPDKEVGAAAQ